MHEPGALLVTLCVATALGALLGLPRGDAQVIVNEGGQLIALTNDSDTLTMLAQVS